ncbi:MAG: hypothetical protein AB7P52_12615 [Alphaproteobacteria bacterium]
MPGGPGRCLHRLEESLGRAELCLDQAAEHAVGLGVRGERRDLALPQIEEAGRQRLDAGRLALGFRLFRRFARRCHGAGSIAAWRHAPPSRKRVARYRAATRDLRDAAFPARLTDEPRAQARHERNAPHG